MPRPSSAARAGSAAKEALQSPQNFLPAGLSLPHCEQVMSPSPGPAPPQRPARAESLLGEVLGRGGGRRSRRCRRPTGHQRVAAAAAELLGSFDAPHATHVAASATPHSPQNRRSELLSWSQDGQRIAGVLVFAPANCPRMRLSPIAVAVKPTTDDGTSRGAAYFLGVILQECVIVVRRLPSFTTMVRYVRGGRRAKTTVYARPSSSGRQSLRSRVSKP